MVFGLCPPGLLFREPGAAKITGEAGDPFSNTRNSTHPGALPHFSGYLPGGCVDE